MFVSIFWKCPWGNVNDLPNLLQNKYSEKKFTIGHSSKGVPILKILIKNENSQIITDIKKPNNTSTSIATPPPKKCIKSFLYTLARRIYTIISNKNPRATRLNEVNATLHQRRYSTILMNKEFKIAEKSDKKILRNSKKYTNEKTLVYVANYNKNNPELFTEIILKNLKMTKTKDKIKEILDTAKVIKSQRPPKNSTWE